MLGKSAHDHRIRRKSKGLQHRCEGIVVLNASTIAEKEPILCGSGGKSSSGSHLKLCGAPAEL